MKHNHTITRHTVPRETFARVDALIQEHRTQLDTYLDRLLWWNRRVNLVSRDVPRETIREHLRHSLLLTGFDCYREAGFVTDAGTGGGLPGIPLALVSPETSFLLNDIVSKKVIALRQMVQNLGLENVTLADDSIEAVELPPSSLLVSKHAFKINELWDLVGEKPWRSMVFYKGGDFEDELRGIGHPLQIESHDLSAGSDFYRGKALVIVTRNR